MTEDISIITGPMPGPASMVLVGVHGNETCGIEALQSILPNLVLQKGKVFFGYGNPQAIAAGKRFVGANLNRMYKNDSLFSAEEKMSYEYGRAQFLKTYFDQVDALLDVHASFTPESQPFAICEQNSRGIVEYLPVNRVVAGFNEIEPGGTDYYMNTRGKVGICVECGYLGDPKAVEVAQASILNFLKARGHLTNDIVPQEQVHIRMDRLYITKTAQFTLAKDFADFESVSQGQRIGIDGAEEVLAEKDGIILLARNRNQIGDEAFLFGAKESSLA